MQEFFTLRRIFINKYVIVLIVFLVLLAFFDKNNLMYRWRTKRNVQALKKEIKYYKDEIEDNKSKVYDLQSDLNTLEKHAREEYFLKRENEDIFIIKEEE